MGDAGPVRALTAHRAGQASALAISPRSHASSFDHLCRPVVLASRVESILLQVGTFRDALFESDLDPQRPWTLLLPIPGAAAVAVTHRVSAWPGMPTHRLSRIASIRTVLSESMLSPDQQDRLSGCHDPLELKERDPEAFAGWLRRNARSGGMPAVQEAEVTAAAEEEAVLTEPEKPEEFEMPAPEAVEESCVDELEPA